MQINKEIFSSLSSEVLERGARLRFKVRGNSMRPIVLDNDTVEIMSIGFSEIMLHDLIYYRRPAGNVAIHRVFKKVEAKNMDYLLVTGGFANGFSEKILPGDVLGKVFSLERGGKRLSLTSIPGYSRPADFLNRQVYKIKRLIKFIITDTSKKREEKLLVFLLRDDLSVQEKVKMLMDQRLDLYNLIKLADKHGVTPLLYKRLEASSSVKYLFPHGIMEAFRKAYYMSLARNIVLMGKLGLISREFSLHEIDVIVLKGMALLNSVYDDAGVRSVFDIDILVKKNDFMKAGECLRSSGFINSVYYPEDFYCNDVMVDLHSEFMNCVRIDSREHVYSIDLDEVWLASRTINNERGLLRILSAEHELMEDCLHFVLHHGFVGLKWMVDIKAVIDHYGDSLDIDKFSRYCRRYGVEKPVYYALLMVSKTIGSTQCMEKLLLSIVPGNIAWVERSVVQLLMKSRMKESRFIISLLNIKRFRDKLIFLRDILFPKKTIILGIYSLSERTPSLFAYPRHHLHICNLALNALLLICVNIARGCLQFLLFSRHNQKTLS